MMRPPGVIDGGPAMMRRHVTLGFAVTLAAAYGAARASAQAVQSPFPPGYSPYLQMINPRGSVTSNYFNLVYPQIQVANNFQQLQQQNLDTRRNLESLNNQVRFSTSKVGFMTHQKYFGTNANNFGVNKTTNTNQRPPVSDASLLKPNWRVTGAAGIGP
jgi:hypothetical protein